MAKKEIGDIEVNGKSIITSLKIIKQICEDNLNGVGNCANCPFFVEKSECCGIENTTPDNWRVLEYTKFQALG